MIDPVLRDREELLSASLTVASAEEIELLFLEFQAAGATFFQTLKREPWSASDFIVRPTRPCRSEARHRAVTLPGLQTARGYRRDP